MFRKKTTLSEYPQTLCKNCDQAAPPPGGPKAGACGRQVEELAFTSGPAQFGRGLWGNSEKKLGKDEEGTRHGVQGGLARHREGTWGLGWGGGGGETGANIDTGCCSKATLSSPGLPPPLPTGNVRNVMS